MKSFVFLLTISLIMGPICKSADGPGDGFWYHLFQEKEFDLDHFLESNDELQLQAQSCTYKSLTSEKTYDYQGLGACLYTNLIEGLSTDALPGVITARLRNMRNNENLVFVIAWRPPRGGFFHLVRKVYRDWRQKPDVGATDTLMGTVVLDFSASDPVAVKNWLGEIQSPLPFFMQALLQKPLSDVSQIRLTAHPRLHSETITDSNIAFYSRENDSLRNIYWDWNFFLLPQVKRPVLSFGTLP